jgi:ubiquinone/menaquinone biosynthesis C-methylase UbiE
VGVIDREREHFDQIARAGSAGPLLPDTADTFRPQITPAHLGGTVMGLRNSVLMNHLEAEGITGKRILDYACGMGKWGIRLAQLGAQVEGFDLSPVAVRRAQERTVWAPTARFQVADARALPYESGSFDLVVAIDAIHHVEKYPGTAAELHRVLKPGGRVYCSETLNDNPLLQAARKVTMIRDVGEQVLTRKTVHAWAEGFHVEIEPMSLTYMVKRVVTNQRLLDLLYRLDGRLLARWPGLERYCGDCVIVLTRR